MARNVYAWPPVDAIATMWSISQPVNRSMSFFTGADISSSAERKRKIASIEVPGIGDLGGSMNGGYCEILKDLLEGGKNLVRLQSMPVNWYFDDKTVLSVEKPSSLIDWTKAGDDVDWTKASVDITWVSSKGLRGSLGTSGSWPTVTLTGLPANTLIARPGEIVKGYDINDLDGTPSTAKVLRAAYSNSSGQCVIYLLTALTMSDHIELNSTETSVFRIDGDLPIGVQPVNGNWSYQWAFREVFSDEVGGFTEIDPWT